MSTQRVTTDKAHHGAADSAPNDRGGNLRQINWDSSPEDALIIIQIAKRAASLAHKHGIAYGRQDAAMDVTAVHLNGCPLRLQELLEAKDVDFAHDVFGIRRFIDRTTGKINPALFGPRFSAPVTEVSA